MGAKGTQIADPVPLSVPLWHPTPEMGAAGTRIACIPGLSGTHRHPTPEKGAAGTRIACIPGLSVPPWHPTLAMGATGTRIACIPGLSGTHRHPTPKWSAKWHFWHPFALAQSSFLWQCAWQFPQASPDAPSKRQHNQSTRTRSSEMERKRATARTAGTNFNVVQKGPHTRATRAGTNRSDGTAHGRPLHTRATRAGTNRSGAGAQAKKAPCTREQQRMQGAFRGFPVHNLARHPTPPNHPTA